MKAVMIFLFALSFAAGAEPIRIACLGNSITAGAGISDAVNDSYPGQLQKLLGDGYVVGNFGNSGRTLLKKGDYPLWVEKEFKNALAMNPNIVIILLGTNDSKPWNWVYRDEFVPDYLAMIDTFKTLPADPQFYICKPPPAFSVQWGIRDSVITADIIPMIEQIATLRGATIVDFYTPLLDQRALFPDDIHPNSEGSWEMAKVVYTALTGNRVVGGADEDVARGKAVIAEGAITAAEAVVDGDRSTVWWCGDGGRALIDLAGLYRIDMFQTDFGFEGRKFGVRYTIETSVDGADWNRVVDQSARTDTSQVVADGIEAVEARFVRLTLLGRSSTPALSPSVNDFKVLKAAPVHAPLLSYRVTDIRPQYVKIDVELTASMNRGEYIKLYTTTDASQSMTVAKDYRKFEFQIVKSTIKPNQVRWYWAKAYKDGVEIGAADTLKLDYSSAAQVKEPRELAPNLFDLTSYPNPFNLQAVIQVNLGKAVEAAVKVYDVNGRLVRTLISGRLVGTYMMSWNGEDEGAGSVAGGMYFAVLEIESRPVSTRKMVLLK